MVARSQDIADGAPGSDSFLDVVANLVGILVILIVVVGVRARDAWDAAPARSAPSTPPTLPDVASPQAALTRVRSDLTDVALGSDEVRARLAARQQELASLKQQLSTLVPQLDQQHRQVETDSRQADMLSQQESSARSQLAGLTRRRGEVEAIAAKPQVIRHYPTPLARTVLGREEHYRLLAGRLAHVPLNQLTDQLKGEAKLKLWKLENSSRIIETIGPIEGFRLQYALEKRHEVVQTGAGIARRTVVELDRFMLIPVAEDMGQPLPAALEPNSEFHQQLRS